MSENTRFNPPPTFPFQVAYRVRTAENKYGYIQSIEHSSDGDYAIVKSEKWDWEERIPLNMLRPARLHYSPATATEPAEIDEEIDDDYLPF